MNEKISLEPTRLLRRSSYVLVVKITRLKESRLLLRLSSQD